jgi:hypothetical protein
MCNAAFRQSVIMSKSALAGDPSKDRIFKLVAKGVLSVPEALPRLGAHSCNVYRSASGAPSIRPPQYLGGLVLSNDGTTPISVLDSEAGVATDSTNAQLIKIDAFAKSIAGA